MDKLDPIVYTADEISALLGMKKSTGYTFIKDVYEKKMPFRYIRYADSTEFRKRPSTFGWKESLKKRKSRI